MQPMQPLIGCQDASYPTSNLALSCSDPQGWTPQRWVRARSHGNQLLRLCKASALSIRALSALDFFGRCSAMTMHPNADKALEIHHALSGPWDHRPVIFTPASSRHCNSTWTNSTCLPHHSFFPVSTAIPSFHGHIVRRPRVRSCSSGLTPSQHSRNPDPMFWLCDHGC